MLLKPIRSGETVLHYAVRGGNIHIVKMLLELGYNKKAKNKSGQTPIDLAKTCLTRYVKK